MKKIIYCIMFISVFAFNACEEENTDILVGGDGSADLSGNQYANIAPPFTLTFLFETTTGIEIELEKFEADGTSIASVQITKVLNLLDEDGDPQTDDPVASAPVTYSVSTNTFAQSEAELFADVPIDGDVFSENEISPGDFWTFKYVIVLASGRELTPPDVTTLTFTCPSDLGGDYMNHTDVSVSDFGPQVFDTEETLVDLGGGRYTVPDMTGGLWSLDPYLGAYGTSARETTLVDICGLVTISDAPDQFGGFITNSGQPAPALDSGTGEISWGWTDTIYGETGVTTYTPL